jgi:hypothetical protein
LEKVIAQKHRRPSARFSMRCGSSMTNLNERCLNSTRSRLGKRMRIRNFGPAGRSQSNLHLSRPGHRHGHSQGQIRACGAVGDRSGSWRFAPESRPEAGPTSGGRVEAHPLFVRPLAPPTVSTPFTPLRTVAQFRPSRVTLMPHSSPPAATPRRYMVNICD